MRALQCSSASKNVTATLHFGQQGAARGSHIPSYACFTHVTQTQFLLPHPSVQGIFVFLAGNVLQCWSHVVLAQLGGNAARPIRAEQKGAVGGFVRAEEREPAGGCRIRARNGSLGDDTGEEGIAGRVRRRHHQTAAAVAGSGNSAEAAAEEVAGWVAGGPEAKFRADGGRGKGDEEGGTVYRIPRGGLFELVSCPHYLGEVVVYIGIVLLTGGRLLNAWLMLAWVVSEG